MYTYSWSSDANKIKPKKQPSDSAGLLEAEAETKGRDSHRIELGSARPSGATTDGDPPQYP